MINSTYVLHLERTRIPHLQDHSRLDGPAFFSLEMRKLSYKVERIRLQKSITVIYPNRKNTITDFEYLVLNSRTRFSSSFIFLGPFNKDTIIRCDNKIINNLCTTITMTVYNCSNEEYM